MIHATDGPVRRCTANDLILVTGGLECANCGATSAPREPEGTWCQQRAVDGPCPLRAEVDGGLECWIHRMIREEETSHEES